MSLSEQPFDSSSIPEYEEKTFWSSVRERGVAMGNSVLTHGFTLYYTLQDSSTPLWAKTTIVGALAYLVFPADAIPDVLPVVGYADDLGALAAATATVAAHIKPEHKSKAKEQVNVLLGGDKEA